jgi:hypothetical protein
MITKQMIIDNSNLKKMLIILGIIFLSLFFVLPLLKMMFFKLFHLGKIGYGMHHEGMHSMRFR